MKDVDTIGTMIVDAAFHIHQRVGPGLFESVYELLLARDLTTMGLYVERQKAIPCILDGVEFEQAFRADLLVERAVIIEIKSQEKLAWANEAQLLTYMKILDYRLGFLINFGTPLFKQGIRRFVNKL